jgi:hypothetical protein
MHRIFLVAGTIIASTIGFALVGRALSEATRNSRRHSRSKNSYRPAFTDPASIFDLPAWDIAVRGYDSPELRRDDDRARLRHWGNNRGVQ